MNRRFAPLSASVMLFWLINSSAPAFAQGSWCARMLGGGENCGFATIGQCRASLSGNGGTCVPSPWGAARNAPPVQAGEPTDQAKAAAQAREAARRRFEEEQRRRAAKGVAPTTSPTVTTQTGAPKPPVPAVAATPPIPLADIDTNATPNLSADGIRRVQLALKRKGLDPGSANGIFDPRMQVAVRTFQTTYGIEPRGVLDNQTLLALGEADLTR